VVLCVQVGWSVGEIECYFYGVDGTIASALGDRRVCVEVV
jgi:hypothetical protein